MFFKSFIHELFDVKGNKSNIVKGELDLKHSLTIYISLYTNTPTNSDFFFMSLFRRYFI